MDYRRDLYLKYVSDHTKHLYGDVSLEIIESQFSVWNAYFGNFLPKGKEAQILDIGCGNGGLVYWLHKIGFQNVSGIDISKEQVEVAKKLGITNVHRADLKKFLKIKKRVYDVIFARDLLEHFSKEEIPLILSLVYSALKSGGTFVGQTVNAENLLWGRLRHGDFTHDIAFTRVSIKQLLRATGFNAVEVYPQRPVIHGLKSLIRSVLWRIFEYMLRFYLLVETGSSKGIFTQNIIVTARKNEVL